MGMAPTGRDLLGLISSQAPQALQPGAGMQVKPGRSLYDVEQQRIQAETTAQAERDTTLHTQRLDEIAAQGAQTRQTLGARASAPGAGRPPTTDQRRAGSLYSRGMGAFRTMEELIQSRAGNAPGLGSRVQDVPVVGNFLASGEDQQYRAVSKEVLAAILRRDTGAAVTDDEFEQYSQMYIPRPGDKPETVRLKLTAAKRSLEAMGTEAGATMPASPDATIDQLIDQGLSDEEIAAILGGGQ